MAGPCKMIRPESASVSDSTALSLVSASVETVSTTPASGLSVPATVSFTSAFSISFTTSKTIFSTVSKTISFTTSAAMMISL